MSISLGIVGSRFYKNYDEFKHHVDTWISENKLPDKIISGGAQGADALAKRYANEHILQIVEYLPDWKTFGRSAGPKRNQYIIDDSTHLLAFVGPKSIGTRDSIRKAKTKGIPVTQIDIDS